MYDENIFQDDKHKVQLLVQAIRKMKWQKIQSMLNQVDKGEVVNDIDPQKKQLNQTPLFVAAISHSTEFTLKVTNLLLSKGANPYHKDANKQTVLYYLAKHGHAKVIERMMEFNFNLNQNDNIGQTPIYFAAVDGKVEAAEVLVKNGADVNHKDANYQTCLFYAARQGHLDMCKFLQSKGINIFHHDHTKKTAVVFAKNKNHRQIVDYLNSLKHTVKKERLKQQKKKIIFPQKVQQSSQNEQKKKDRKKEVQKVDYCMVYTNEKGQVHELSEEQILKFRSVSDQYERLYQLIRNPQKLQYEPSLPERKFQKIANKIISHFWKQEGSNIFHQPVDWETMGLRDYPTLIPNPMDFGTIKNKLAYNAYHDADQFRDDMLLVFDNCIHYNGKQNSYTKIAIEMKLQFINMYNKQTLYALKCEP